MKALKVMASINDQGQLMLDYPLQLETNSRVEVIILVPEPKDVEETSKKEVLADFQQAWHEAMTGQTISVTELWEGLEKGK
jgi:hypothetical protein